MNNSTTKLKDWEFNGKYYPKIKRIITAPRKKIRSKLDQLLSIYFVYF